MRKFEVENMKGSTQEILRGSLVLLRLFVLYFLLFVFELLVLMLFANQIILVLLVFLIINIIFVFKVMHYGFKKLRDDHKFERVFSLLYGVACYLCLIVQFAMIFYLFYISLNGGGVLPKEVLVEFEKVDPKMNNAQIIDKYFSPILTYVFPGFYKFPAKPGIFSIIQYFVGKFIDLFVLAYIVEAIRKRTGLK